MLGQWKSLPGPTSVDRVLAHDVVPCPGVFASPLLDQSRHRPATRRWGPPGRAPRPGIILVFPRCPGGRQGIDRRSIRTCCSNMSSETNVGLARFGLIARGVSDRGATNRAGTSVASGQVPGLPASHGPPHEGGRPGAVPIARPALLREAPRSRPGLLRRGCPRHAFCHCGEHRTCLDGAAQLLGFERPQGSRPGLSGPPWSPLAAEGEPPPLSQLDSARPAVLSDASKRPVARSRQFSTTFDHQALTSGPAGPRS